MVNNRIGRFFLIVCSLCLLLISDGLAAEKMAILAIKGESAEGYDPTLGWGRYGSPLFQSTLLKRDVKMKVVNDLAIDHSISKDGKTWIVKIRRDAKFSNGSPVTAKDVVYTFQKTAKIGGKVDLTMLKSVSASSEGVIRFELKYPCITFLNKLITLGIVPEAIHGQGYGRNPIGSGPYKMVHWEEGHQLIVETNPFYYGEQPELKKVTFLFADEDTSFAAAKAGKVHMVAVPQLLATQKIPGMHIHPVKSVDNRGIMFPFVPNTGKTTEEGYPIGNNVTADPSIRKAVNVVIDRQSLVDGVLEGYGTIAFGTADHLPWGKINAKVKDGDRQKAAGILAQAGWADIDNDGVLEKGGLKAEFSLVYPSSDSVRQSLALASADMIRQVGIKVNLQGKSWDEIKKVMHSSAVLFGWGSHDPIEIYNLYHSSMAGSGWYNSGFYQNAAVDHYLDQAMKSLTYEQSLGYWQAAQWDGKTGFSAKGDAPWAWLVNLTHTYYVSDCLDVGISQVEPHGHGWPITANIHKWKWICN